MRRLFFTITEQYDGISVKTYARSILKLSARVLIKQKYSADGLQINGNRCKTIDILKKGDVFSIHIPDEAGDYEPADLPFPVIYEDEDYIAVNKPAGMPVHPSAGHDRDSLLNAAAQYFAVTGRTIRFRPLYRLDKDTSGIVLIGKNRLAVSSAALEKTYYAVCEGVLVGSGEINAPIGMKEGSIIEREVGHGQPAVTKWQALCGDAHHTLLKVGLCTGRTHQIRVHMAHIGHPLAGDDLYGGSRTQINRQALHCGVLHLRCDVLRVKKKLTAEIPGDIINAFPFLTIS